MRAVELMRENVVTIRDGDPIDEVLDVLVGEHIHGTGGRATKRPWLR